MADLDPVPGQARRLVGVGGQRPALDDPLVGPQLDDEDGVGGGGGGDDGGRLAPRRRPVAAP